MGNARSTGKIEVQQEIFPSACVCYAILSNPVMQNTDAIRY
ncbi:hypothetical protein [Xenorhabdus khoisanae]|nr:hypothetical protein [Xenorhabdus khoisanae]